MIYGRILQRGSNLIQVQQVLVHENY